MTNIVLALFIGIAAIVGSVLSIVNGTSSFRGFPVPIWACWVFLFIGVYCLLVGGRELMRRVRERGVGKDK